MAVMQWLVQKLGADPTWSIHALYVAAEKGDLAMVRCLIKELDADGKEANVEGASYTIANCSFQQGHHKLVRCLFSELHADVR